jgi:iron complex transport system permease protein
MALGVGLSAAGVAVAGPLSFVGLAGPRVPLAAGVVRHRLLVPAAAVWGAVVVVGADAAVQSLRTSVGFSELPAGVATALIGAPLLLVLARRIGADGLASSVGSTMRARSTVRSPAPVFVAALLALLVVCLAGLLLGEVDIPLGDAIAALFGGGPELAGELIRQDRLPRVLTACLAGMCLGVSGAVVQAVGRNALAEPGLLGITGGAAVGAMVLLVVAPAVPAVLVPLAAFAGAVAALAVVVAAAWRGGLAPERLLLVGISVAAFTTALVSFLVVISGPAAATALLWLTGSTYARGMNDVAGLVLWPLVLLPLLWFGGRHMDLLALGDDLPRSLGLRLERTRLALIAGAVLLAAAAVSTVGAIGFIGLLAPHLARASTGNRHRWLVALSAVYGALLLVAADLVSRLVNPPGGVPSGLVVAVLGAPAFVVMLTWRERRAPSAARHRRILWWRRAVPRLDG